MKKGACLKACLRTRILREVSKLPPKERRGTLIPVFPKGLTGILAVPSEASAGRKIDAITDPAPAMPAAFINARRDQC